jgi:hypothetical protein
MRQAEINAAACGSNSASGAPLPLAKKPPHIFILKKTFEKRLIKRGKFSRVELCLRKIEIQKYNPERARKEG